MELMTLRLKQYKNLSNDNNAFNQYYISDFGDYVFAQVFRFTDRPYITKPTLYDYYNAVKRDAKKYGFVNDLVLPFASKKFKECLIETEDAFFFDYKFKELIDNIEFNPETLQLALPQPLARAIVRQGNLAILGLSDNPKLNAQMCKNYATKKMIENFLNVLESEFYANPNKSSVDLYWTTTQSQVKKYDNYTAERELLELARNKQKITYSFPEIVKQNNEALTKLKYEKLSRLITLYGVIADERDKITLCKELTFRGDARLPYLINSPEFDKARQRRSLSKTFFVDKEVQTELNNKEKPKTKQEIADDEYREMKIDMMFADKVNASQSNLYQEKEKPLNDEDMNLLKQIEAKSKPTKPVSIPKNETKKPSLAEIRKQYCDVNVEIIEDKNKVPNNQVKQEKVVNQKNDNTKNQHTNNEKQNDSYYIFNMDSNSYTITYENDKDIKQNNTFTTPPEPSNSNILQFDKFNKENEKNFKQNTPVLKKMAEKDNKKNSKFNALLEDREMQN